MRNILKAFILSLGLLGTPAVALADSSAAAGQGAETPGPMTTQGDGMKGGDGMPGMMGMMQMMQQMGPMMERCNEMMAAMTEHMKSPPRGSERTEDNG